MFSHELGTWPPLLMIKRELRIADSHETADEMSRQDDNALTSQERFAAFMKIMEPYYAAATAAGGFQRVYRVDDLHARTVSDDWLQNITQRKS